MMDVSQAGPTGFVFVALGVFGFFASFASLLAALVRPDLALKLAPFTLVLGLVTLSLGPRYAEQGKARAAQMAEQARTDAERDELQKAGEAFAQTVKAMALQAGMLPVFGGVATAIVALVRRKRGARAD